MSNLRCFLLVLLSAMIIVAGIPINHAASAQTTINAETGTVYIRSDGNVEGTTKILQNGNIYTLTGNINAQVIVEASNITINGNLSTLQGSGVGAGFNLTGVSNVTIKNTNIKNFDDGIRLDYSNYTNILSNNITANDYSGIHISSNECSHISIIGNYITGNERGIDMDGDYNEIRENIVNNNTDYGFIVKGYSNLIVGNNLMGNNYGIYLYSTSGNTLKNNRMTNNDYNFQISMFLYPTGLSNDVDSSNLVDGKPIYYWRYERDKIIPSDAGCVILYNCRNITVTNLILQRNGRGIIMGDVTNSTITGNVLRNSLDGVWLIDSYNNYFLNNSFVENNCGVWLNFFDPGQPNFFYHNNFLKNTQYQAHSGGSSNHTNLWDNNYPSGGNYWSNYKGTDDNNDGIGDTPYTIYLNNTDRYPLITPFGNVDFSLPSTPVPDDGVSDWSNDNTPTFTWPASTDIGSGVAGYFYKVDNGPETWKASNNVTLPEQTEGHSHILRQGKR